MKKIFSFVFLFSMLSLFMVGAKGVSASTTLASYNFSGTAAPFGGKKLFLDYLEGQEANYVRVDINAIGGDKYDLRLVYTHTYPSERQILASKNGITAKGSSNTFYFIPQNGTCPGVSSQCIVVPVVSSISDSNHTVSFYDVMYGIEIYNGSWLGGTLSINGTYSFINY